MNPEASEAEVMIRDGIRKFLDAVAPLARQKAEAGRADGDLRSFWREAAAIGVTSLLVPEEFGGAGLEPGPSCLSVVAEEMGRVVGPGPLLPCNVVADTLARSGSPEQQQEWLPPIATGECIATWAWGEPGNRWLADAVNVRATRRGGGYLLEGVKSPVESGQDADLILVTAASDDGVLQLLVPTATPGVKVVPLESFDLARNFARIHLDQVDVAASAVVGDIDTGRLDVERQTDLAMCLQSAETSAMTQAVLDMTVEYLKDRYAFGRTVASYQAIKHRLADHKVWLESSLGVSTAVAKALSEGDPAAGRLASAAKVHIGDQSLNTVSDCSQLLGGISMTWEHDHHVYLRRVTANRSMYGSPVHHRERLCRIAGL